MLGAMGIFQRSRQVIASNFNALLDHLDDPKKSIELLLDEMKEQIRAARREVVRGVAGEKQLRKRVEEVEDEVAKWERRAELSVRHGDDALAREALLQKRRLLATRERTEALRTEQLAEALEMKKELQRMERKLEELAARKGTLVAKVEQARAGGGVEALGAPPGGSAFAEFQRMEDQIEGVEAALSAQREVDAALRGEGPSGMTRDEVEARFAALEGRAAGSASAQHAEEVEQELSALKRRVRIGD
jgi:phage shock protein A